MQKSYSQEIYDCGCGDDETIIFASGDGDAGIAKTAYDYD